MSEVPSAPSPSVEWALARVGGAWRALRPHQWLKNIILLVPLAAAHRFADRAALVATALGVIAFCLVASAGYLVNDLADAEADRAHPRKRRRPIAAGEVSRTLALVMVSALLVAAGLVTAWLPTAFALLLAGYAVAAVGYTFAFRSRPALDVIVLAGMYTVRIFAGGFAAGIPVSEWLASFSMFLFVSLAFLKRAAELVEAPASMARRGYVAADRDTVLALGISAGLMSVVVFTLYLASPEVTRLYAHPRRLWAICPLILHWVAHLWLRARRGEVQEDPLVVALTDRASWITGALGAAVVWTAL